MQSNGDGKLSEESTFPYAASSVSYIPLSSMNLEEKVKRMHLSRTVPMTQIKGTRARDRGTQLFSYGHSRQSSDFTDSTLLMQDTTVTRDTTVITPMTLALSI